MDLDQITPTESPSNSMWKRRFSSEQDSGFLWFAETSYHYISPRGVKEWASFLVRFLPNWVGFRRMMKAG